MGSHRSYRHRNYAFSKQILQLRTRLVLTQSQLAELIGVHWHSVQKWETGESYPKAETLQRLIEVCLRHQAVRTTPTRRCVGPSRSITRIRAAASRAGS